MSKFNVRAVTARGRGFISGEELPSVRTHEGAPAYVRDAKSELFLLAVTNMVGEDTFYERAGDRDDRFTALVAEVAVTDFDWLTRLLTWLRAEANLRSVPIAVA